MKNPVMLAGAAVALALLSGCGDSSDTTATSTPSTASTSSTATATTPATTPANTAGVVVTTKHNELGTVLAAGPKKMTVYLFEADKGGGSACTDACAQAWPPVTTSGAPTSAAAAKSSDLGTIARADGATQVTYKGHPLYYFVKDTDDEDAYGEGSKAFGAEWYVLAPSGNKIEEDES
ncbi:MAG TPA: hypothetical protein VFY36_07340 [Solirubrobacteraceae bacterium]|nr:hypothetical protein [Solirubrobacteraceae bacterium]